VLLLALSLGSPSVAAPWLQAGYDAARTGAIDGTIPAVDDVAFQVALPGSVVTGAPPLMMGDGVYVLVADRGLGANLSANGLFRVDLAAPEPVEIVQLGGGPGGLASDGESIFITSTMSLDAYDLMGDRAWSWAFPILVENRYLTECGYLAVRAATVYTMCTEFGAKTQGVPIFEIPEVGIFAAAIDTTTGRARWTWFNNPLEEASGTEAGGPDCLPATESAGCGDPVSIGAGISVLGSEVVVVTQRGLGLDFSGEANLFRVFEIRTVEALKDTDGSMVWRMNSSAERSLLEGHTDVSPTPTGTSSTIYLKLDDLMAVNAARGNVIWTVPLGREDPNATSSAAGVALRGGDVYTASGQTLYKVHTLNHDLAWKLTFPPGTDEFWTSPNPIVSDDTLVLRSLTGLDPRLADPSVSPNETTNTLYVVDAEHGTVRWSRAYTVSAPAFPHVFEFGAADGLLAVAAADGNLTVFGRAPSSIQPSVAPSTLYPAAGGELSVSLTGTGAGYFGAPTAFRAQWGDGNESDWQASPVFHHVYAERGDARARFWARNDKGQDSSDAVVFHVGSLPPSDGVPSSGGGVVALLLLAVVGAGLTGAGWSLRARRRSRARALLAETRTWKTGELVQRRYRVQRRLGEGGLGAAYLCRDQREQRDVVLKTLRSPEPTPDGLAMLLKEARALGALRHPNVVALHSVEQAGLEAFVVMEYLEGGSLAERLRRGKLEPEEFVVVASDALAALEAVHAAGIVHRDVKPSNLLLTKDGRLKLADFGIAHIPGFETTMGGVREGSTAIGTIRYMSPEQARGHRVTPQSDLFSLAATLYEAYTGKGYLEPGPGESPIELQMRAAAAGPFDRPLEGPVGLRAWFARALHPEAERRFASAVEMREALERAMSGSQARLP
jgi:outer membrane protein assembly factor BamB/predicted Ser/Thr protein kinase